MNRKQLLADFYLQLLSIPFTDIFRINNQSLYAEVLHSLSIELNENAETIQRIFERMAAEDGR